MAEMADSKIVALPAVVDLDALDFVRDGLIEAVGADADQHRGNRKEVRDILKQPKRDASVMHECQVEPRAKQRQRRALGRAKRACDPGFCQLIGDDHSRRHQRWARPPCARPR